MTEFSWQSGVSGDWTDAADWGGTVPNGPDAEATISAAGSYSVTIGVADNIEADSVTLNDAAATLDVAGVLNLAAGVGTTDLLAIEAGSLVLAGTIENGTIAASDIGFGRGATLADITYVGDLELGNATTLNVSGGLQVENSSGSGPGTIGLSGSNAMLVIADGEMLNNLVINLGDTLSGDGDDSISGAAALTLGADVTLNSNAAMYTDNQLEGSTVVNDGQINVASGRLYIDENLFTDAGTLFVNAGTISVAAGADIVINPQTLINTGTILIGNGAELAFETESFSNTGTILIGDDGVLSIDGYATQSDLSGVSFSASATLQVLGTLDLGAGTLSAEGAGTALIDGTVENGTIMGSFPGTFGYDASLDNITYLGDLNVTTYDTGFHIENGLQVLSNNAGQPGTINLEAYGTSLDFEGDQTLNNVVINLGEASLAAQEVAVRSDFGVLTLGSAVTVNSYCPTGEPYYSNELGFGTMINEGQINVDAGALDVYAQQFTNTGTIIVAAGATLELDAATFANTGVLDMAAGSELIYDEPGVPTGSLINISGVTVVLGGSLSLAQLDSLANSNAAQIEVTGILSLDGGTYSAPAGETPILAGTIANGTIAAGQSIPFSGGPTFDNITYLGTLDPDDFPTGTLAVAGGLQVEPAAGGTLGTIDLSGRSEHLAFLDNETVDNLVVLLGSTAANDGFATISSAAGLTFGSAVTIISNMPTTGGENGLIGQGFTNDGRIDIETGVFTINARQFVNNGTVDVASGATLELYPLSLTNSGLIEGSVAPGAGQSVSYVEIPNTSKLYASGTFSGGSWEAGPQDTLAIVDAKGGPITTDNAVLILDGKQSEIETRTKLNGGGQLLESSLATIGLHGALELLDNRGFTATKDIDLAGTLALDGGVFSAPALDIGTRGLFSGAGTIAGAIVNSGTITAADRRLDITGAITGTGVLSIGASSILELGGATSETVVFDGEGHDQSMLRLDAPTEFTGTLSGLRNHSAIQFFTTTVTAATLSGTNLLITLSGGTTLDYKLAGTIAGGFARVQTLASGTEVVIGKQAAVEAPASFGPVARAETMGFIADTGTTPPVTRSNADLFGPVLADACKAGPGAGHAAPTQSLTSAGWLQDLFGLAAGDKLSAIAAAALWRGTA